MPLASFSGPFVYKIPYKLNKMNDNIPYLGLSFGPFGNPMYN